MRRIPLFLLAASLALAQSGLEPPSLGVVRDDAGRLVRLEGAAGALTAVEVSGSTPEWLAPGWEVLREEGLPLRLWHQTSGRTLVVPLAVTDLVLSTRTAEGQETTVAGVCQFPLVMPGDQVEFAFRLRNQGTAAITVTKLALSGNGFVITEVFSLPRVVAPGFFADFKIRYRPEVPGAHRATLQVNERSYELRGDSKAQPRVEVLENGVWLALSPFRPQALGSVERGGRLEIPLRIVVPEGAAPFSVPPSIQGAAFRLAIDSVDYKVLFEPKTTGVHDAKLSAGDTNYPLQAAATEYAAPLPLLSLRSAALESGQQESVSIRLSEPARAPATGMLRLEFTPETAALPDDASIAFLPERTRSISFTVAEGATEARFNGAAEVQFQTGATAGTITLTATLGEHTDQLRAAVAPASVRLDSATANRGSNIIEIRLAGIDNTRSAGKLVFLFFRRDGSLVAPGAMEVDSAGAFAEYYKTNPTAAGTFSLRAQFLVSGAIQDLEGVEIRMFNKSGAAETGRLRF